MFWMDIAPSLVAALALALATQPAPAAGSPRAGLDGARPFSILEQLVCEAREGDRFRFVSVARNERGELTAIVDEEPLAGDVATTLAAHDGIRAAGGPMGGVYASGDGRFRLQVRSEADARGLVGELRSVLADGTTYSAPAMRCAFDAGLDAED